MTQIQETFEIHASPETVFDRINDVESTSDYGGLIHSVRIVGSDVSGEDIYRYKIIVAGIPLTWDSKITERIRPSRICWESIKGIELKGSFELTPSQYGSNILFQMKYHVPYPLLSTLLEPLLSPLARKIAKEAVEHLKAHLSQ
ncbi:MAG: SRPBCC family protein [Mariprofundaceae bacterium]